jgi:hypothetical protein
MPGWHYLLQLLRVQNGALDARCWHVYQYATTCCSTLHETQPVGTKLGGYLAGFGLRWTYFAQQLRGLTVEMQLSCTVSSFQDADLRRIRLCPA